MIAPAAGSVLHVAGLHKRYGDHQALAGVDLWASGGVVTLLGPNGAGKTTLLRCVATAIAADSGELFVDGLDPRDDSQRVEIRRRLGFLPQEPRFAGNAFVFDVVDYFGILKGIGPPRARHADVRRVLGAVGLAEQSGRRMRELSGGMQRRVGIAQALLGDPTLVVLDEPAAGLDPEQRLVLRGILSRLGERATVLVSTHLTDEAASFSQQLVVLHEGRARFRGTPADLIASATGRTFVAADRPPSGPGVAATWRLPDGRWRGIGVPPPGVDPVEATLEDAYLLLVGAPDRVVG